MSITGIGSRSSLVVQSLVDMRRQLDDLQRQLGTGKKSDTYAGIGLDRGLAVGLRSHLVRARRLRRHDHQCRRAPRSRADRARPPRRHRARRQVVGVPVAERSRATARPIAQSTAYSELGEILGLLNTQAGDRYLFSGRAADQPAVETHRPHHERRRRARRPQADRSRSATRPISAPAASAAWPSRRRPRPRCGSPRTRSRRSASSSPASPRHLTGATVTPSGPPTASTVDLGAVNPNDGETIQFRFTLPDGTSESITLTATTSATPGPNEFTIGADRDVDRRQSADRADRGGRQARRHLADGGLGGGGRRAISSPTRRSASPVRRSTPRPRWSPARRPNTRELVHRRDRRRPGARRPRPPASTPRSRCPTACAPTRKASAGSCRTWPRSPR